CQPYPGLSQPPLSCGASCPDPDPDVYPVRLENPVLHRCFFSGIWNPGFKGGEPVKSVGGKGPSQRNTFQNPELYVLFLSGSWRISCPFHTRHGTAAAGSLYSFPGGDNTVCNDLEKTFGHYQSCPHGRSGNAR